VSNRINPLRPTGELMLNEGCTSVSDLLCSTDFTSCVLQEDPTYSICVLQFGSDVFYRLDLTVYVLQVGP
jgi:hypothetical protein